MKQWTNKNSSKEKIQEKNIENSPQETEEHIKVASYVLLFLVNHSQYFLKN